MYNWLPTLLVAPFIGSFLGVLIRRLPLGQSVLLSRSACQSCGRHLVPLDLVPLISFAALCGRCRICRAPISRFHPAIELAALAVAVMAVFADQSTDRLWSDCALGWWLLALAWIDAETQTLPDVLTLPLLVAGLTLTWLSSPSDLIAHVLGTIAGYAGFRLIAVAYLWFRKREGLGEGDAKLLAAGGAWLGIQALPNVVLLSATLGIVITLTMVGLRQRHLSETFPFGTAIAATIFLLRLYTG